VVSSAPSRISKIMTKTFTQTFVNPPKKKTNFFSKFKTSTILGVRGKSLVSNIIARVTALDGIPPEDNWSHVAGYVQCPDTTEWVVIESHIDTGCVRWKPEEWLKENSKNTIESFTYCQLDPSQLIVYPRERIRYGTKGVLREFLKEQLTLARHLYQLNNTDPKGVYCSELYAKCDKGLVSKFFNLKPWEAHPAHFKKFAKEKNLEITLEQKGN